MRLADAWRAVALAALVAATGCRGERRADPTPPAAPSANLLIYLVDTLRVDHLGCYGYARPVSPEIDAFAARAVLFENAVAQSSWTRPTAASILTGLTPLEHGVRTLQDRLADEIETLPEMLRAAGWTTAAFSSNWHVSPKTGFAQGIETFDFAPDDASSESLTRRVLAWLDAQPAAPDRRPWFVYAHALDPHGPYQPPPDLRQRFAPAVDRDEAGSHDDIVATMKLRRRDRGRRVQDLRDLYDAEIADTDRAFGRLLEGLRIRGVLDDTMVILVADHGEGFDEHALLGHGNSLYGELVDIPLIIKPAGPGQPARRADLAAQVDLVPTALAALGQPERPGLSGRHLLAEAATAAGHHVLIDLTYERRRGVGIVTREWKYLRPLSRRFGRHPQLFSRLDDRLDQEDLASREAEHAAALARILARELRQPARRAPQALLDADTAEGLRALGYL